MVELMDGSKKQMNSSKTQSSGLRPSVATAILARSHPVVLVTDLMESFAAGPELVRRRLYDELRARPHTSIIYVTDLSVAEYEQLAYAIGLPFPDALVADRGGVVKTARGRDLPVEDDFTKGHAVDLVLDYMRVKREWVIVGGCLWEDESIRERLHRGYALAGVAPFVRQRAAQDDRLYLTRRSAAAGHLEGLRRFGVID